MRQDRWEKDGQPRMKVVISAQTVQLLGGGQDKGQAKEQPRRQSPFAEEKPSADGFTDDVPF